MYYARPETAATITGSKAMENIQLGFKERYQGSHSVIADLRFSLIGDGGMQHGSQHRRTVWPILLLNHLNASCMSAHMQPFDLLATQVQATAASCTAERLA